MFLFMKKIEKYISVLMCFFSKCTRVFFFELRSIPIVIICIFCSFFKQKYIVVSAWCIYKCFYLFRKDKIVHNNWGDDINVYFLEMISNKKVWVYPNTRIARFVNSIVKPKKIVFIGSVLTLYSLENSIVIGSGVLNNMINDKIKGSPNEVLFVRGPLSRQILINNGVDCPQRYGDPALLLSCFYKPQIMKHCKIGIIPHYQDLNSDIIVDILTKYSDDVVCIKMKNYSNWTDIIDEINSCDFIISSSLHGLIVSETYKVPSVWVHFNDYIDGWDFKFYDFYQSIGKKNISPINIQTSSQIWDLYKRKASWKSGEINYLELIKLCKNVGLITK